MSMIKIEFPADDRDACSTFAEALKTLALLRGGNTEDETDAATRVEEKAPAAPEKQGEEDATPSGEVDMNGVAKDAAFCASAKDPFYKSGARKGQWKKRLSVSDEDYDAWYAAQPQAAAPAESETENNTAAAFGANTPPAPETAPTSGPQDGGGFITWVSEGVTAGRFTNDQVQAAWAECGLDMADLFPPNAPDVVSERVASLVAQLPS